MLLSDFNTSSSPTKIQQLMLERFNFNPRQSKKLMETVNTKLVEMKHHTGYFNSEKSPAYTGLLLLAEWFNLMEAGKYKFGNTQVLIPKSSEASHAIEEVRASIDDEDLAGEGKDVGGNHITVRYGLQSNDTDDTEELIKFIESQSPFTATLGKTSYFPPSEHSDDAVPIIAPITAPELHKIEKEIDNYAKFSERNFPDYNPHSTIAYVKPEAAKKYTDNDITDGKKFIVDNIAITNIYGHETPIKLLGKK